MKITTLIHRLPIRVYSWLQANGPGIVIILMAVGTIATLVGMVQPGGPVDMSSGNPFDYLTNVLYNTARMFVFDADPENDYRNVWLRIGALSAVLLGITAVCGLLGWLWERSRLAMLDTFSGHVVICGAGRIGGQLVRSYLEDKEQCERVVLIEPDESNHIIKVARELGALVIVGDATHPETLRKARAFRAKDVWIVTGEDVANLEVAAILAGNNEACYRINRSRPPVCHLHVSDISQAELLDQHVVEKGRTLGATIKAFSFYQKTAQCLLLDSLVKQMPSVGEVAHFVVVGFGRMGQTVARELALQAHFENGLRSRMTIVDVGIAAKRDAFLNVYPSFCPSPGSIDWSVSSEGMDAWGHQNESIRPLSEACSKVEGSDGKRGVEYVCNAEFIEAPIDCQGDALAEQLRSRLTRSGVLPSVIVCLDGDGRENFEVALRLRGKLTGITSLRIHVWMPKLGALAEILADENHDGIPLVPFGMPKQVCTPGLLRVDPVESLARIIHEQYVKSQGSVNEEKSVLREWEKLTYIYRKSNMQRALHTDIKLAVLGMQRVTKMTDTGEIVSAISSQLSQRLGAMEHNRWMAERLMDGWVFGLIKNDQARPKTHHLLIPYEALSDNEKMKDLSAGEEIMNWAKAEGTVIVRRK